MIYLILIATGCAVYFIATIELQRRKYRRLWCVAQRHADCERGAHSITCSKLQATIRERDEWERTARLLTEANKELTRVIARQRKEITAAYESAIVEDSFPAFVGIKVEEVKEGPHTAAYIYTKETEGPPASFLTSPLSQKFLRIPEDK